ncbi:charged multivesicular body protein 4b-like [Nasonia vitripennis]|uniref:Uncharacterized protein n=1 Tax=Nasonia vitripennis TaxID=7425 RepID=A0A7M7LMR6_NASVI|nr:charged multivesicular body protein 4b-like [Nasonia vitripennis]
MSKLFAKIFGKKKKITMQKTADEAIQELRKIEELLGKRQDFLESKMKQEETIARQNSNKNKRAAIQALKRRRRFAKQLQQIDARLSTLEMQREALESANTHTAVLTTMKNAADALRAAYQNMDVDQVHDMMGDIAEQQDLAEELANAISNPAFGQEVDEAELEKELDELEQEEVQRKLLTLRIDTGELPDVPATALPTVPENKQKKTVTAI